MVIPVIPTLNTREQWLAFCRRERPYAFIEQPDCLLDFQSTFLKITLLPAQNHFRDSLKYSLGARTSMEPVWRLIKACQWDLGAIIQGLEQMDFSSNVRDNSLLKLHTDLSVRKYFSREPHLVPPQTLGILPPVSAKPSIWGAYELNCLISNRQFSEMRSEIVTLPGSKLYGGVGLPTLAEVSLTLMDPVEQCHGQWVDTRLHIFRGKQPYISLIPDLRWPKPRLKKTPA